MTNQNTYEISKLDNGVTVASASMPHMSSVSLGIWVAVGGRFEPAEWSGVSHFIEHLLFKGTGKRTARQISEAIEGIGGDLNAFTSEDNTCFYSKARHDHFSKLLDVMMDMFLNSRFDEVEIQKERNVIRDELTMYIDQPQQYVQDLLNETIWPDNSLGRCVTGNFESIDALDRNRIVEFYRNNYVTNATLVSAAGPVDHERLVRAVSRFSRKFNRGQRPRFEPASNNRKGPNVKIVPRDIEQTQLAIGFVTCSCHDKRRYAVRILNAILGENMSSRLFQALRENHGLTYNITSYNTHFEDTGMLAITAGLDPEQLIPVLDIIRGEILRLAQTPPGRGELKRARDYLLGQLAMSLENTTQHMMWNSENLLLYGRPVHALEIAEGLMDVKPRHVRAVAREFLTPERSSLSLVGPVDPNIDPAKHLAF
ncbi:MAG: insulinase family protein [Verrucomicrobia bacterium]|nr:insulinase family protein [Verrucomicrobiota bacterium]MCF7709382.1 insulinase family protein [Verrucomicrobiota bacterium]